MRIRLNAQDTILAFGVFLSQFLLIFEWGEPGKSHGQRSLEGCSPWGRWGSDTTERLQFHFSLSCIGEGNGNPLQCSCLENPRDGRAWWAAVYRVTQSRTRLKWLSSSRLFLLSFGKSSTYCKVLHQELWHFLFSWRAGYAFLWLHCYFHQLPHL